MKNRLLIGGITLTMLISSYTLIAGVGLKLPAGEAEVLFEFVAPNPGEVASPESIAFDQVGNMYISVRTYDDSGMVAAQVIKLTPDGDESVLADFVPGGSGVAGLETDRMGNVYAAVVTFNEDHGVWKVYPDGTKERLAGSENIMFPDGLTMDRKGNLYVTDYDPLQSGTAHVWKYSPRDGYFSPWLSSPLLVGGLDPLGNPMGGANGIVFSPPNHIYIGNTQQSLVIHVPVMQDGSAGEVMLLAAGPPLVNPDGMAVDANGNVYVAIPASTFPDWIWEPLGGKPPIGPVVRIIPETGMAELVLDIDFPSLDYFDFPTCLAFGKGPWDHKSVFVVSMGAANFGLPFGTITTLTQVGVGIPGQTGQ